MLIFNLVIQEWKKNYRAQGFYKNLAVSLLLGLFAMYMAAVLLFLGVSLSDLLEKADDRLNPLQLFNGAMLYVMIGGLLVRFAMQQLNTFNLTPYQALPIKRSLLVNFLLLKPLANPANYFLLLVVIPFAIKSVVGYYNIAVAMRFVFSFILLVWFDSLTTAFLKRRFGSGISTLLLLIIIFGSFISLEYFQIISLFETSERLYSFIILKPFGLMIPALGVFAAFLLNKWFFRQNHYAEKFDLKVKEEKTIATDLTFLNRFGLTGELISLELKLILRHKRTKSILYMSGFFLLYGLIFYTGETYRNSNGMLFFVAMFITGLLMLMFGQWVISWDSNHFDCLMTRNIPVRSYLKANYFLMIAFNIICFVLTTPYFLFGQKIIFMHFTAFIFNCGVNTFLLLFLSTFNTRRVDLSKTSAMNYQGTTYKSFLIVFPIMFVPMIIVGVLSALASLWVALWTLAVMGAAGILLRRQLLNLCVNQFNRRKYKLAEGFRQSE